MRESFFSKFLAGMSLVNSAAMNSTGYVRLQVGGGLARGNGPGA